MWCLFYSTLWKILGKILENMNELNYYPACSTRSFALPLNFFDSGVICVCFGVSGEDDNDDAGRQGANSGTSLKQVLDLIDLRLTEGPRRPNMTSVMAKMMDDTASYLDPICLSD